MSKLTEILNLLEFPAEASGFFEEMFEKTGNSPSLTAKLDALEKLYFESFNSEELEAKLSEFSNESGYHKYSVDLFLALYSCIRLKDMYAQKGYSTEFFAHTMKDLTYKLIECKKLHDIWGSFVFPWFAGFYKMDRFCLGRLQYEPKVFEFEYGDIKKKGDTVINIHIPSAGPLLPEDVQESLRLAYDFFGPNYGDKLVFMCHSWLLYPPTAAFYPDGSNMKAFYDVFEIIHESEEPNDYDLWRVFYVDTKDYKSLPRETTLQKKFYDHLNAGNHFGNGLGMIVYSPDNK